MKDTKRKSCRMSSTGFSLWYGRRDSPPAGGPGRGENVPPARFLTPLPSNPFDPMQNPDIPEGASVFWYGRRDSNPRPVSRCARKASGGLYVLRTWRSWVHKLSNNTKNRHPLAGMPVFGTADGIRTHDLQSRSSQRGVFHRFLSLGKPLK